MTSACVSPLHVENREHGGNDNGDTAEEDQTRLTDSFMSMRDSMNGTDNISNAEILKTFDTVHTSMNVRTIMFSAMYAPSDDTTLMVMVPRVRKEPRHLDKVGKRFTVLSEGIGDVQLHGLHIFYRQGLHRMHFDAGVSVPTGSVDEGTSTKHEHYMQQLGSGTVDLLPGLTYLGETKRWAWGTQLNSALRLGDNKHDYTFGNRYGLTSWITRRLHDDLAMSLRLNAQRWGNVRGVDDTLNPLAISENDPNHQGGKRVDALVGLSYYGTEGALEGHRIELEVGTPIYQKLNGPQLKTQTIATVSWKIVF